MTSMTASTDRPESAPLDRFQRGHLRRILNLARQLPDDWSGMMGRTTLQEDFGGYRFQLAYMAFALALTHIHRLPAAPGYFRKPMERLIEKMRSPDVWTYWHYVSTGNGPLNKAQGELPAEWNPVIKDNIMYSAYLQSMALLYHYLFKDDRYAQEGALSLVMRPLFWGSERRFPYDERSLNEHIYWSMAERGYLGIACEPNCVFQICNQVPILGFRLHDLVYGGSLAQEVTQGYLDAWSEFGILNTNGHFNMMVMEAERVVVTPEAPWSDFWLGALMHAWNPEVVEKNFPSQIARWSRSAPDGTLWIEPEPGMKADPERASARDFGWAAACASEVGDAQTLQRLLDYADRHLHPCWKDGAYFYQRHDELYGDDGLLRCMDPHTGNALLGYARLNVPNGLKRLYEGPLDEAHFKAPALAAVPDTMDVLAARFQRNRNTLALTLADEVDKRESEIAISGVWNRGSWTLRVNGNDVAQGDRQAVVHVTAALGARRESDCLKLVLPVSEETDIELVWH